MNIIKRFLSVCFVSLSVIAFSAMRDWFYDFGNGGAAEGLEFVQAIKPVSPRPGANVQGDVRVSFTAVGMSSARISCWRHGDEWGEDAVVADLALDPDGSGSFVFPADRFPNGPLTLRLQARDDCGRQDYFELQLYNLGGVKWRQGLPSCDPPPARGLELVFADDFDGPISVSSDGQGARYAAHKTGGGDFSGWPFSDPKGDCQPFGQQGTFLRIHASKPSGTKGRTGILSSLRADGTGVAVSAPAYFECRFICHSAPGSWGAFWTLTQGTIGMDPKSSEFDLVRKAGCDELDVIECYGGYGPRNPNHGGHYGITTHFWGQENDSRLRWSRKKSVDGTENSEYRPCEFWADACAVGGGSSWSWTFHTYGVLIGEKETVYYFDDIEMLRHPTGPVSRSQNIWFLINYAIGGSSGWPSDLTRYGDESDMWVDWVRVYSGKPLLSESPTRIVVQAY